MHIIIDTFSPMPMGRQLWLWLRLPLLLLLRDTDQGHIDCAVINTHSQIHTHANMQILRRRLDFSQCKNRPPQTANGTCTVYMHFSSLSRSLSFRLYLALLKRTEQSKPVSFLLFLCVALLLINKHALWQGLLNQAPIPRPIPSVPLPLHSTHHLSVHPKRDSVTTKRIHTNIRVPAYTQYTAHTHAHTHTHVQSKLS